MMEDKDGGDPCYQKDASIKTLRDLPQNTDIDEWLEPTVSHNFLKPISSRVKLVVEYNMETQKYQVSKED